MNASEILNGTVGRILKATSANRVGLMADCGSTRKGLGLVGIAATFLFASTAQADAPQIIDLNLTARGVLTRVTFDYGGRPRVDSYTTAQTGGASSGAFSPLPGISNLLAQNPSITTRIAWDASMMAPWASNGTLSAYLGGSNLTVVLPNGNGSGSLTFSNAGSGFQGSFIANNAREVTPYDFLMLPGAADFIGASMEGSFSGSGMLVPGASQTPVIVDLLTDPMFRASYNGAGSLASLNQLIVRVQSGTSRSLAAIGLDFLDRDGDALPSLQLPQALNLAAFEPASLSFRFSGEAAIILNPADYASQANFSAASSFVAASGLLGVGIEQYAMWTAAPIPEPDTAYTLLLGALTVLCIAGRRRSGAVACLPRIGAIHRLQNSIVA